MKKPSKQRSVDSIKDMIESYENDSEPNRASLFYIQGMIDMAYDNGIIESAYFHKISQWIITEDRKLGTDY